MSRCKSRRDCYRLRAPNDAMVRVYLDSLLTTVLGNPEVKLFLTMNFNRSFRNQATRLTRKLKTETAVDWHVKNCCTVL